MRLKHLICVREDKNIAICHIFEINNITLKKEDTKMELVNNGIETKIYEIRGLKVMLDSDLAKLYDVETKRINEAVKNNPAKFPDDFMFELSKDEEEILRSKFSTFKENLKSRKYSSKVFTEQGVYMLATILKRQIKI